MSESQQQAIVGVQQPQVPSLDDGLLTRPDEAVPEETAQAALSPDALERVAGGIDAAKPPVFGGGGGFSGGGSSDSW